MSDNGTYQDDTDREAIQKEVDALKSEVDRISTATEYNGMKLLDGSLSSTTGTSGDYGAKFGLAIGEKAGSTAVTGGAGGGTPTVTPAETTLTLDSKNITISNATTDAWTIKVLSGSAAGSTLGATKTNNNEITIQLDNTAANNTTQAIADKINGLDLGLTATPANGTDQVARDTTAAGETIAAGTAADPADGGDGAGATGGTTSSSAWNGSYLTSNVGGVEIVANSDATEGGENASWSEDGLTLTLNLVAEKTYTQTQINELIKNADTSKVATGNPADVAIKLKNGIYTQGTGEARTGKTVAGVRSTMSAASIRDISAKGDYADKITLTSNNYGVKHDQDFKIVVDAEAGQESAKLISTKKETLATPPTAKKADNFVEDTTGITGSFTYADATGASKTDTKGTAVKIGVLEADGANKAGTVKATWDGTNVNQINISVYSDKSAEDDKTTEASVSVDQINAAIADLLAEENGSKNTYGLQQLTLSGMNSITVKDGENFAAATTDYKDLFANTDTATSVDLNNADTPTNKVIELHVASGVEYTEADLEKILLEAGYDYDVKLEDKQDYDGSAIAKFDTETTGGIYFGTRGGKGVGNDVVAKNGNGLTFQIGANGTEDQRVTLNVDDMSSDALGITGADVSTRDAANEAIEKIDAAVKTVSMQRAGLGAMQNRLEYTVNNLTTTSENLTNAESQIRDTDMASEMINYTKFNILQQASQAMLAQANQQPQAILQLLG